MGPGLSWVLDLIFGSSIYFLGPRFNFWVLDKNFGSSIYFWVLDLWHRSSILEQCQEFYYWKIGNFVWLNFLESI